MLKLVDSHDLKSCGFSRPSSSLGEATLRSNIKEQVDIKYFVFSAPTNKTKKNCIKSIYDNVYDMICCTQHEKKKVAVVRLITKKLDLKSVPFLECQFESGRRHH